MRRKFSFAIVGLLTIFVGCSQSSFPVAPVHGKVTANGQPLFQGKVMFAPVAQAENSNPGKPAWGAIGSDGSYRLSTFGKDDGAVVGEHWVTIVNSDEKLPEDVPEFARVMLPKRVTVNAGQDNAIDIALTSEIIEENFEDDR